MSTVCTVQVQAYEPCQAMQQAFRTLSLAQMKARWLPPQMTILFGYFRCTDPTAL